MDREAIRVYLIIDCEIKEPFLSEVLSDTHINLSSLRDDPPSTHPQFSPSAPPPPPPSTTQLSVRPPTVAPAHQQHFSRHANSCLTVMALKAEQGASQCVSVCAHGPHPCVSLHSLCATEGARDCREALRTEEAQNGGCCCC